MRLSRGLGGTVPAIAGLLLAASTAIGPNPVLAQDRDPTRTASLPRGGLHEREVALPAILTPADVTRYRRIFAFQSRGDWAAADREAARLSDRRLVGHMLAERYLHRSYRSSYGELVQWMRLYHDHPDASAIHELAQRRAPRGANLQAPTVGSVAYGGLSADDLGPPPDRPPVDSRRTSDGDASRATTIRAQIRRDMRSGDLADAERVVRSREAVRTLPPAEQDHFKAAIAAGLFAQGDAGRALELASEAASRSGASVPRAHWIAGLALYRSGQYLRAASHFEALARAPAAHGWSISAGAFWAGRAYLQAKRFDSVNYWFSRAAEQPRTFYGLLAARTLGIQPALNLDAPALTEGDVDFLQRSAGGSRALALLQVGEEGRAEAELRRLPSEVSVGLARPLLVIAMRHNMPDLSVRLGRELAELDGRPHDGALYPIPRWRPQQGFEIDRALLFAFARQESGFNPRAVSHAGARGLMQLMPQTAKFVAGGARVETNRLYDPNYNLSLGQRYIRYLLDNEVVQGDLILLAAAYNGGPGNLQRWRKRPEVAGQGQDDALMFIEGLPAPETRHFITRILYHYWMYAMRLGQPTPSLDAIAAGDWPTYISVDGTTRSIARNAKD